jgi:hypothetical protein
MKYFIAFLSVALLFVMTLTVSQESHGTTDHEAITSFENPVYVATDNVTAIETAFIGVSTQNSYILEKQVQPSAKSILDCDHTNYEIATSIVLQAYYRQECDTPLQSPSLYG